MVELLFILGKMATIQEHILFAQTAIKRMNKMASEKTTKRTKQTPSILGVHYACGKSILQEFTTLI